MFIFALCDHKSNKVPQEDLVLVEIWLLIVADSDHGVENLHVAAWMEENLGPLCGSYIWGRCVYNM